MPNATRFTAAGYCVAASFGDPPGLSSLTSKAALHQEFFDSKYRGYRFVVTVTRTGSDVPHLVVVQDASPGPDSGFSPGIILIESTQLMLIGAGTRLLAYDLAQPAQLWLDSADTGFWGWSQYGDIVLMSAELEFAAWSSAGRKLWSTFVEPPWAYRVEARTVHLDVMGKLSSFNIEKGPVPPSAA